MASCIEINGVRHYPLDKLDFKLIILLAENNMRATETAYTLKVHRGTVVYRINRIKRITGLDPMKFYDLHKLVEMARREINA